MVKSEVETKPIDVIMRIMGMTGFALGLLLTISAVVTGHSSLGWF